MEVAGFKLVLEKAEEPEIKLPTSAGSSIKQESSRKTSTSALLTMPKLLQKLRPWHLVHHFMANDGEKVETLTDFIFFGSKITVNGDCSQEIEKCLIFERKAMTNLDILVGKVSWRSSG